MADLVKIEARMKELEKQISPIANQTIDIAALMRKSNIATTPAATGKGKEKAKAETPLERAKVTTEAETLVEELIEAYQYCGESDRDCIRVMLAENASFDWATGKPPAVAEPADKFRRQLLRLSMSDQGRDPRDLLWSLENIQREAKTRAIDLSALAREVAALSSDQDRFGMGSTKKILLDAAERWEIQK